MKYPAAIVIAIMALVWGPSSQAQIFGGGADKPSSEFIPRSAVAAAAVFAKKLAANPDFKVFPHEVVTAWGKKELGFDPMLIEEITLILQKIEPFPPENGWQPGWAAVLHFEEMQGLAGAMIDQLEEKKIGGKTVFSGKDRQLSFMVFDESTIIIGNDSWFDELITAGGRENSSRCSMDQRSKGKSCRLQISNRCGQCSTFCSRSWTVHMSFHHKWQISWRFTISSTPWKSAWTLTGKLNRNWSSTLTTLMLQRGISDIVAEGMQYGKVAMLAKMAEELDLNDPVQAATLQYTRRVAETYEAKLTPAVNGSDLTVTLNEEILALPVLLGIVGSTTRSMEFERKITPTLATATNSARVSQLRKRLRQIPDDDR